jgi:hypothetical protein
VPKASSEKPCEGQRWRKVSRIPGILAGVESLTLEAKAVLPVGRWIGQQSISNIFVLVSFSILKNYGRPL